MDHNITSKIWEGLGSKYLTNSELITAASGDKKNFVNLIKQRFFQDVWKRMKQHDQILPPFLINYDFALNCCKARIEENENTEWGHLEIEPEGFRVLINKNLSKTKKRTVLAHELGHIFLFDLDKKPIKPYYERQRGLDLLTNPYEIDEGFVYEIGRFLLIPSQIMKNYISEEPSLESFFKGCSQFQTTKDVMAKRLFWDKYDFEKFENYWSDALLIFYPFDEGQDNLSDIPKGGKYIFRGSFFKNFQTEKYWEFIMPLLRSATIKPDVIINHVLIDSKKQKYLFFKKSKIVVELKYLPKDRRIYILVLPK
jgi:hypothetical protein